MFHCKFIVVLGFETFWDALNESVRVIGFGLRENAYHAEENIRLC